MSDIAQTYLSSYLANQGIRRISELITPSTDIQIRESGKVIITDFDGYKDRFNNYDRLVHTVKILCLDIMENPDKISVKVTSVQHQQNNFRYLVNDFISIIPSNDNTFKRLEHDWEIVILTSSCF